MATTQKPNKMKYKILLLVAMVIGSYCWGQKDVSKLLAAAAKNRDTICFDNYYCCFLDSCWLIEPKQDTVKVLLLCTDTSSVIYVDSAIVNGKLVQVGDAVKRYRLPHQVYWQFGHEVRKYHTSEFEICDFDNLGFDNKIGVNYCILQRLDQNKNPLPKSIVVWITKEIK